MTTEFISDEEHEKELQMQIADEQAFTSEQTLHYTQMLRRKFIKSFDFDKLANEKIGQQRVVLETLNAMDTAALDKLKIDAGASAGESMQQAAALIAGLMSKMNEGAKPLQLMQPVAREVVADNLNYNLELVPNELDIKRSDLRADNFIADYEARNGINRGD